MTFRRLTLAAAVAACTVAAVPQAASAGRLEVAVQDDLLFLHRGAEAGSYFSRDLAFEKVRAMQGSVLRVNLIWTHALANDQVYLKRKPKRVRYDWAAYESLVELARGYGVKVQFSLTGPAPAWATASGDAHRGWWRPNPRHFKQFVRAAARRFKGKVDRYSIWNEPNYRTWLGPPREAAWRYRQLYQLSYRMIKRISPRAKVLFGETSPYKTRHAIPPLKFLRRAACVDRRYRPTKRAVRERGAPLLSRKRCSGGPLEADGYAHHPYEFKRPPARSQRGKDDVTLGSLDKLTKALDRLKRSGALVPRRGARLPLYLTEYGYFRAGDRKISERRRAKWTVKGFRLAAKNPRVKQLLYYVLVRPPGGTFFDLSLLDHDGDETRAYRALVRWATRAAERREVKRPRRKRDGVSDTDPPPPPAGEPPPPPPGEPPPEEPPCEILPGIPCPEFFSTLNL